MLSIPVITGVGLATALGPSADETWDALLAGRYIRDHWRAPGGADRISDLATCAAREALAQSRWTTACDAIVIGTSKGAIEEHLVGATLVSPFVDVPVDLPVTGPRITISAACASGLHALVRAAMMIRSGEAQRVLVVAAEASVHPLFLASFKRLGVLAPEGHGCRPFDQTRDGFLMSDAAAAVCLESAEASHASPPLAKIERFALFGDATHLTGGDAGGQTLRRSLRHVADHRAIDVIHAHGTGTVINDAIELRVLEDECAAKPAGHRPIVVSHKGALGHSLGASGLVSTILNCLMHARQMVPPNVRTAMPLAASRITISSTAIATPIHRSLALAAGFGGATGAVSFISP